MDERKKGKEKEKDKDFFHLSKSFSFKKKKYWKQKYKIISSFHSICMKFNL